MQKSEPAIETIPIHNQRTNKIPTRMQQERAHSQIHKLHA